MKKLFPEEKEPKKRFKEFLDKKGFYVVLILCIAVVAGTAIYVYTRSNSSDKSKYDAENVLPEEDSVNDVSGSLNAQEPIGAASSDKTTPGQTTKDTTKDKLNPSGETTKKSNDTSTSTKKENAKAVNTTGTNNQGLQTPLIGDICFEYAKDKLVYSKTLEEWCSHEGIDYAADRGTPVKAAADGVVSEIKNDPRYGIVVVIDHKNGLKTVYANLAADDMVTTNQKIKQGEVIGCVGNTAAFESADQSHLHFEVLKDNEIVNPAQYLPKTPSKK